MKTNLPVVLMLSFCALMAGCTILEIARHADEANGQKIGPKPIQEDDVGEVCVAALPSIQSGKYKVDPYISAASSLQAFGREKACEKLLALADVEQHGAQVFVLCRMLFTKKPGSDFKRPSLGGPSFLANTEKSDWPLEPIELVDGVPFLITRGYLIGGEAESPAFYVRYCIETCDWNRFRFRPLSDAEKRKALDKLLASNKWKSRLLDAWRSRLSESDREFFAEQIK